MHNSLAPLIAITRPGISPSGWAIEPTAGGSSLRIHPCDACCKKTPQDATQNLAPPPQLIEQTGFKTSFL